MKRREFLKNAAIGAVGLASLPFLNTGTLPTLSAESQNVNFHFIANSRAGTVENIKHTVQFQGDGTLDENGLRGGGTYNHFDDATAPPKIIITAGTWEAKNLINWNRLGSWGMHTAGVMDMDVNLLQQIPSSAVIPATIRIVCNLGIAHLINPNPNPPPANLPEGYVLTIPGANFGSFVPFDPPIGVTLFTTGESPEDKALYDARGQLQTTSTVYLPTAALVPTLVAGGLAFALARAKKKGK